MGLIWLLSVPIVLYLFRKYRVQKWGSFRYTKTLKDRVFIITGANSGLGKETAKELASLEATVIMACRDLQKARNSVAEIREYTNFGDVIPMELDLASFASIKNFSEEVHVKFPKINVLINNAGVSVPQSVEPRLTKDGYEINFGTNHLGHFLLTKLLIDKLEFSAPSRVVIVSSKLHERGAIDFNSFKGGIDYSPGRRNGAYNNSKLANVYFCRELAKRLPSGVETFSLCPGFCYTGLFRYSNLKWYQYILMAPVAFFFMKTAKQGCQTILYCALSDEVIGHTGKLYRDCKLYDSTHKFTDELQLKLWDTSENMIKQNVYLEKK